MTAQIANGGFKIKPRILYENRNDNLKEYLKFKNENPNEPLPTDLLLSNFNLQPLFKNQENINLVKDAMFSSSNEPGGTSIDIDGRTKNLRLPERLSQIKRFTEAQREAEVKQESLLTKIEIMHFVAFALTKILNMRLVFL